MASRTATAVAVTVLAGACGSSSSNGSGGGGSGGGKTYTIGVITDLSGPASNVALTSPIGIKAGVGRAAKEGYNIKYIVLDGATNPTTTLTDAQRLVEQDHVFAVIGLSAVLFSAAPYLHSKGVPVIGAAYDATEWLTDDNMFSVFGYQDYTKVTSTFGSLLKLLGATNLASIGYGISPSSADTAKAYALSAKNAGLQAGYVNANVPFGSTNVGPLVLAMRDAHVDAFSAATETSTALAAIVGLRQQGVDLKAPFLAEGEGDLIASGPATEQQAKGVYLTSAYEPPQMDTPATRAFAADMKDFAGVTDPATSNEYLGYLSVDAIVQGLKAAGKNATPASFIQSMLGITNYTADGLTGSHSINFAMAQRGSVAGADNCTWYVQWNGTSFDKVAGADPICGQTLSETVSSGS